MGTPDVQSLSCPNCAGAISVSSARGTPVVACSYCGSILDQHDDFKVLQKFQNREKIDSPHKIGDFATYRGQSFEIIGLAEWKNQNKSIETWIDHLLYSPTHGYIWVSLENGHYALSRRVRGICQPAKLPLYNSEKNQYLWFDGVKYQYWDGYTAELIAVEGEMNWHAAIAETASLLEAVTEPNFIEVERQEHEVLLAKGHYLGPEAVQDLFGLQQKPSPGFGPFGPKPIHDRPLWLTPVAVFAFFAILTFITAALLPGRAMEIANKNMQHGVTLTSPTAGLANEVVFTVPEERPMVFIQISTSGLSNQWAYYDVELLNDEDEALAEVGRETGFYSGRDSDGSWTETTRGKIRAKLDPGTYTLSMALSETDAFGARLSTNVSIRASAYAGTYLYFLVFAFIGLTGLAFFLRSTKRRMKWESD